jgi:hypothetical protein
MLQTADIQRQKTNVGNWPVSALFHRYLPAQCYWFRPYIPVPPALVNQSLFLSKLAWRQVLQRAVRVLRIVVLKPVRQLLHHGSGIRA